MATVWITGEHKRCFPGFHVANLAAALASKNCPVHLYERSGLLPNAGYFMSLSPRHYIRWDEDGKGVATGLGDVEVDCSSRRSRAFARDARIPRVEVFHVPPLFPEEHFLNTLKEIENRVTSVGILVVLGTGRIPLSGIVGAVAEVLNPATTCTLHLGGPARGRVEDGRTFNRENGPSGGDFEGESPQACREDDTEAIDLGCVSDWEHALNDRVPAVLRAPGSALSQAYRAAADGLFFKINDLGRKSDASRVCGISTGIGSGPRHR